MLFRSFENFDRAHALLRAALAPGGAALNALEREGTVHRFEYTFELSWKLMKDYLEADGVALPILTPRAIIDHLQLRRPIYRKTAAFGHFGRTEASFTWEATDKAEALRSEAGVSAGARA